MFNYPLVREVMAILTVKMIVLIAAGLLVFAPHRLDVTAASVEAHVFYLLPEIRQ